ncbi:MAG: histidine kinase [Bacteroidota bacterium]
MGYRLLRHLAFWWLSYYLLLHLFAYEEQWYKIDYLYTLLFHFSLVVGVYLNRLVLIPRLLLPHLSWVYLPAFACCLLLTVVLNQWTFGTLSDILLPQYFFINYYHFIELCLFAMAYLGISTLLHLSRSRFTLIEAERQIQQLRSEKIQAELQALKAQLNPHFLFNSLNSIYYLAMEEQERSPQAILQLAQVMRYVLHESNKAQLPLEKEIQFIQDYIDLQSLRSDQSVSIQFEIEGADTSIQIAPLLFIPFVENAFKHGLKAKSEAPFVHICLKIEGHELLFQVKNNKGQVAAMLPDGPGGVGLANIKKRLALLYPKRHQLLLNDQSDYFETQLKLQL